MGLIDFDKLSKEYDLLFNYLIPHKQYLAYHFFVCSMSLATKKDNLKAFYNTKRNVGRSIKTIITNGFRSAPDPNDAQDLANNDPNIDLIKFILKS